MGNDGQKVCININSPCNSLCLNAKMTLYHNCCDVTDVIIFVKHTVFISTI